MFSFLSTFSKRTALKCIALAAVVLGVALPCAAQINPSNQIKWPSCAATQYYVPFNNTCVTPASGTGSGVLACNDTSGSGTAQICTTSPSFVPAAGKCVIYSTTTANSGTGLTLNVNSSGAAPVAKWLSSTTLIAGDVPANKPVMACFDGTNWDLATVAKVAQPGDGNAAHFLNGAGAYSTPAGGGSPAAVFPVDNYGCVGDGNVSANTGTDNTSCYATAYAAAVAAGGGILTFDCGKYYRFATAGPTITNDSIGIASSAPYCFASVFTSSSSAMIIAINGASESSKISNNSLQWIGAWRAVAPASSSVIGIQVTNTSQALINETVSLDSPIGYDIYDDPSNNFGGFTNNASLWGFGSVSWSATTGIGFQLRGGTGTNGFYGFQTLYGHQNFSNINVGRATITTAYGTKISGGVVDLNWDYSQTANQFNYPVYLVATTTIAGTQDVHITNIIADLCETECVHVDAQFAGSIEISGGQGSWATAASVASSQTSIIHVTGSSQVAIKDFQFFLARDIPAILIDNSSFNIRVANVTCQYGSAPVGQCVSINGSDHVGLANISVEGGGHTGFPLPQFKWVNSSGGTITGLLLNHGTGTPLSFDASSNNNCCWNTAGNSYSTWGSVSDAGTGNQYVPTLPNSLTMNNSGSGAASPATFDGSAAKTLSYNTLGAQCALTLTNTGTSGAATLGACSGGTAPLNIPIYSGGGGGGGAFSFNIIQQAYFNSGGSNTSSYTVTFPLALQGSGATAWMIVSIDGSGSVTAPTGWTVDINQTQATFARLMVMHVASAGQTSATFTLSSSSAAVMFMELTGTRTLDASSSGGVANASWTALPAITTASGAMAFGAGGACSPASGVAVTSGVQMVGGWSNIQVNATVGGGRWLNVVSFGVPGSGGSVQPPALNWTEQSQFASCGIAYAAFSIK